MDPKEVLELAVKHARGIWRFRWIGMGISWAVLIIGVLSAYSVPNRYLASTRVYVDTENLLRPLLSGLYVETNVMNDVALMTRALLTRPHLEAVVRKVDLDVTVHTESERELLLTSLEERTSIARARGENIFTIEVEDKDRDTSLKIVNALLQTFVDDTLGSSMADSESAEQTLSGQIAEYEKRLMVAEQRLSEFKKKNVGLMPGEGGGYYNQMQSAIRQKELTERELRIASETLKSIENQLAGVGTSLQKTRSSYDDQIQGMESQLNQLLLEYTDKHPEVVRTLERLQILGERRERELSGLDPLLAEGDSRAFNPIYQNVIIQLSEARVQEATLKAEIRDSELEIDRLTRLVEVVPEVEAELARLNRDYDVVQGRYQDMLIRWENLQTGKVVSSGRDQVTFRVIEPPFAASRPVSPDRQFLLIAWSVVAIGAGLAVALLMHLLRPVFASESGLSYLGVSIVGQTSYQYPQGILKLMRIKTTALVGVALLLLVVVGLSIVYQDPGASAVQSLLAGS